jgi:esterase/lipase superfamily enzyme
MTAGPPPPKPSKNPPGQKALPPPPNDTNTTTVRVFFGTDRRPVTLSEAIFANEPSTDAGRLSLGWCEVSIPRLVHRIGDIERPTFWTLNTTDWFENPDRHFMIQVRKIATESEFRSSLRQAVEQGNKQILLFIHGYNTSFDDAMYRSAQLAVDLKFRGATALYSWPSNASVLRYAADRDQSLLTLPSFKRFIRELSQNSGATTIHVIAHSMGNNALVHGLSELAREETSPPHFRQIIMAAPDVDRREFERLADAFSRSADHFTLYAADNDRALGTAEALLGDPRIGDSRPMFLRRGLDSIDASSIIKGFLKHSYFADPRILADIEKLIAGYQPPPRFGLIGMPSDQRADYWTFR